MTRLVAWLFGELINRAQQAQIDELRAELRVAQLEAEKLGYVCTRDRARVKAEAATFARTEADAKVRRR